MVEAAADAISARPKNSRIRELDLLRFITASGVMFFHYTFRGPITGQSPQQFPEVSHVTQYGFLGVEMFFLISGFVIPMSVSGESVKEFFASRIVRLYPAFWVCCTITFVTILAFGQYRYHASLGQYLVNMTMLSGFVGVHPMDEVYHTLFIEIVWYAIVGGLLAVAGARRTGRFSLLILAVPAPILLASGLLTGLFGWNLLGTAGKSFIGAYWMYFIGGYVFYRIWSIGLRVWNIPVLTVCWLAGIAASMRYIGNFERDVHVSLSPVALTIFVTACFGAMALISFRKTGRLGDYDWRRLGAMTYPLYLIHQVVGMVILTKIGSGMNRWLALALVSACSLTLAYLVNTLVERPVTRPMRRLLLNALNRLFPDPTDQHSPRHRSPDGAKGLQTGS